MQIVAMMKYLLIMKLINQRMSNLSKRVNTNDMADSLEKLHLSEINNKRLPETNTVEVDELTKSKPIINEGNSGIHSQSPTKPLSELHDQIDLTRSGSSHNIIEAQEQKVDNERQKIKILNLSHKKLNY